jgi:hypothetical protein
MKSRFTSLIALFALATAAFAQSDEHHHAAQNAEPKKVEAAKPKAPKTEAQLTFEELRSLAGEWEGLVTTDPVMPEWNGGKPAKLHVTMRVTSRGSTITHEFQEAGTALDWMKYDHPVTMIYRNSDDDQLTLVHYCDAGNRPRMIGKKTADGKVDFTFADLSGSNKYGNMYHATFIPISADRHIQEWTFMLPGNKSVKAKMELQRTTGPIAGVVGN